MGEGLSAAVLISAIGSLCLVIAFLFRLLYNDIKGQRDYFRDELMKAIEDVVKAVSNVAKDQKTIAEAQSSMRDEMRRIREELAYKRGPT